MIGYTFKVPGNGRVFLLTRVGKTRVFDLGPIVWDMSAADAAAHLGHDREYRQADDDVAAWGRLILAGRQGGYAPIVGQRSVDEVRDWLRGLSSDKFESLVRGVGCYEVGPQVELVRRDAARPASRPRLGRHARAFRFAGRHHQGGGRRPRLDAPEIRRQVRLSRATLPPEAAGMIRDPETMTSKEVRQMQLQVAARILDARRRAELVREHDQSVAELRRLLPLQEEIEGWE